MWNTENLEYRERFIKNYEILFFLPSGHLSWNGSSKILYRYCKWFNRYRGNKKKAKKLLPPSGWKMAGKPIAYWIKWLVGAKRLEIIEPMVQHGCLPITAPQDLKFWSISFSVQSILFSININLKYMLVRYLKIKK